MNLLCQKMKFAEKDIEYTKEGEDTICMREIIVEHKTLPKPDFIRMSGKGKNKKEAK